MFTDLERPACVVTKELIQNVADNNPERFKTQSGINISGVLDYLGFSVYHPKDSKEHHSYSIIPNVYVRDYTRPDRVYKTTIYSGKIRNSYKLDQNGEVLIDSKGFPLYDRHYHELYDAYLSQEVLQPPRLSDYVSEDAFESILDIGSKFDYDKG